mmetsp:Transcript_39303/g.108400  ORF Transcript_39303/g.108400 Transcript_39303/m.108400 type:complete len:226 (-) Transcript_39303:104-781(-)
MPKRVAKCCSWRKEQRLLSNVLTRVAQCKRQAARVEQKLLDRQVRPFLRSIDGEVLEVLPTLELVDELLGVKFVWLALHCVHRSDAKEELGGRRQRERCRTGGPRPGPAFNLARPHRLTLGGLEFVIDAATLAAPRNQQVVEGVDGVLRDLRFQVDVRSGHVEPSLGNARCAASLGRLHEGIATGSPGNCIRPHQRNERQRCNEQQQQPCPTVMPQRRRGGGDLA